MTSTPLEFLRGPSVTWEHRPGRGDELRTLADAIWDDTAWPAPRPRWPRRFVDEDRADAHQVLTDALEHAEDEGRRIPCRGADAERWVSEDPADARAAAAACERCPVVAACRSYALGYPEPVGTWGALTVWARRTAAS